MIAIFSCHAVLCILVAPVWSSPVPSSKVADADRKTLNSRNTAVASMARDEGSLIPTTQTPSVASNFLSSLVENNNAVHMAFEGEAPQENYANLPYTPIMDYAFVKPENSSNSTPNWQDTLANIYKNPHLQNGGVVKLPPIKIVGAGSESKFPLVLEIVAQRIQAMFSTYSHEDLSRPPTWDSGQALANRTSTTKPRPTTRKPTQITKTTKTRATTRKPTHTTTKYLQLLHQEAEYPENPPDMSTELMDITFTKPIPMDNDSYIYVGEGDDEFDRGVHRRKPRNSFI